jgi:hypothetical protein
MPRIVFVAQKRTETTTPWAVSVGEWFGARVMNTVRTLHTCRFRPGMTSDLLG